MMTPIGNKLIVEIINSNEDDWNPLYKLLTKAKVLDLGNDVLKYIKKDDIISIVGENDKKLMNLMIAHNPIYFPSYKQWGADLVLSGHIHGGIIRIPGIGGLLSPDCTFFPKYDGGMFSEDGATMIVSRGLGTHTIPIRIFNPGELVCVDIHAKSATTKADNQDR